MTNNFNINDIFQNIDYDFLTKFNNSNLNRFDFESPYYDLDLSCKYFNDNEFIEKCANIKNLKFLSWNIQSLNSKFEQLKDYIDFLKTNKIQIDVIALQETFSIINFGCINIFFASSTYMEAFQDL